MNTKIAIIDYKMSNLFSVKAACEKVGLSPIVTSNGEEILSSDLAILPGVGAFGSAMDNIKSLNLDKIIYKYIESGKFFMGICLGLQLLFENSEEFGYAKQGLGIIKGTVKKFNFKKNEKIYVPQIGWNKIFINEKKSNTLPLKKDLDKSYLYFVHSYYVVPEDSKVILSETKYGEFNYCSSILKDNIFACQFHPEKSGTTGLEIYKNIRDI